MTSIAAHPTKMSKLSHQDEDVLDTISLVQDGDFEAVREVLSKRIVPVNAKDGDHCTLLHWAAINNRIKIATMLIEYGADHIPGGLLNETPLQWALRKKYYKMMSLLIEKLHVDLRHRSTQGFDALHLACRAGDVNGVFLLLSYGANPNSLDNDGNTPLLYLVKSLPLHRAAGGDMSQHNRSLDMIRMLLMFGADVTIQDLHDKNTVIHLLAQSKLSDIMSIAFYLYQAGTQHFPSIQNAKAATPYKVSVCMLLHLIVL
jgi:palmitoyltransferase